MVASATGSVRMTPEQFLELPDWKRYELVDGELVEMPEISTESSVIAMLIGSILSEFVRSNRLGIVAGSDATYQSFPDDPSRIRRPDVSFISRGRLSREQYSRGHTRIAPDIAIEVISPNDDYENVDVKVEEYLSAGVRLVWVINPKAQVVMVHHPDQPSSRLRIGDQLTGEDVLPGFSVAVAELFPDPTEIL